MHSGLVKSGEGAECNDVMGMARVTSQSHGYISSTVNLPALPDSKPCPWVIEAYPGQHVNLSLIRLPAAASPQYAYDVTSQEHVIDTCFTIAVVAEAIQEKSIVSP